MHFRVFVLSCFRDFSFPSPAWLFVGLVWTSFAAAPLRAEQNLPAILREVRIEQRLNEQIPGDLEFRDETGRKVRLGDYLRDRPHVLILIYFRCPKLCPLTLDGLTSSLRSLADLDVGKQFDVIAVSFDPQDTPSMAADKKESYAASYGRPGADSGWHFLTGPQPSIDRLTKAVGFHYVYDPKLNQFIHASGIMLLTPEGRISRYLLGVQFLPRDLRLGLVEASNHKIGSPVDQALLYCFHYDPETGKYTVSVMNFVRVGCVLTVVVLASLGTDVHVHDSYFVIAHFHFIMVGGMVMGYMSALHYWWPKMSGRKYPEGRGRLAALTIFFGFILTFLPQFFLGYEGMARRYYQYDPKYQVLNVMSSTGAVILALGYVLPLVYLLWSLKFGPPAGANLWGATGLEWQTPSPPPTDNFEVTPVVTAEPYDYSREEVPRGG